MLDMGIFYFGLPGNDCTKDKNNCRRSRPPSAADFLCCFGVLNTIISWESKIKYTHIEYISWNIFFSRSNYLFKNRFLMNFAEFWEFGRLGVGWPGRIIQMWMFHPGMSKGSCHVASIVGASPPATSLPPPPAPRASPHTCMVICVEA